MVCLTNRQAGSGGDEFPEEFQQFNMGPVIGTRTWGGLVGTLGYPSLMDGGYVTAPNVAIWTMEEGFCVENVGVPPDIEVIQDPAEVIAGREEAQQAQYVIAIDRTQHHRNLALLDLEEAEEHGTLDPVVSYYSPDNDRVYDGPGREGFPLVTMAGVLSGYSFPLAETIQFLLDVGKAGFTSQIEIEFAVNLSHKPDVAHELAFLQIRPMVFGGTVEDVSGTGSLRFRDAQSGIDDAYQDHGDEISHQKDRGKDCHPWNEASNRGDQTGHWCDRHHRNKGLDARPRRWVCP